MIMFRRDRPALVRCGRETFPRRTLGGSPVAGFSEDFAYDPIGNSVSSTDYDETGAARTYTYTANALNQYTARTVPGWASVRGLADADAAVAVNGNAAYALASGDLAYFFGSDDFDNSMGGGFSSLEVSATVSNGTNDLVSVATNKVFVPPANETYAYDADGNQTLVTTGTGAWQVEYNGENRPVKWTRVLPDSSTPNSSTPTLVSMTFDHQGRRRLYVEVAAGVTNKLHRFTYDDYVCIARNREIDAQHGVGSDAFVWDPTEPIAIRPLMCDLSGDGALFYCHDGNKNVSETVSLYGTIAAHYEYSSFGKVVLVTSESEDQSTANLNPYRFSSEYADDALGLPYYNYRHYDPRDGRWICRDRLDDGWYGILTYNWCFNSPFIWVDVQGNAPQYIYPGVIAVYDPIDGGRIIQSPDIDWGGGLSRGNGGISASIVSTISFLFGNHEFINSNGCSFYCIGLTTQTLGISGGASVGNGSAISASIGEGVKVYGGSIGSLDGGIGLSMFPAQANLRLICLPLNDEDENGCPCKDKAPKSIFGVQ